MKLCVKLDNSTIIELPEFDRVSKFDEDMILFHYNNELVYSLTVNNLDVAFNAISMAINQHIPTISADKI